MSEPGAKPHDRLFRLVFSDPEHAAGELRHVLPAELVARIDWGSLETVATSVVDAELRESESDLIFRVAIDRQPALLYVLVEHQSGPAPFMALRLLRYMVRLWDKWLGENAGAARLPPIVPLVVHHGAGGWSAPESFHELVDWPSNAASLIAHVPSFRYVLDDLSTQTVDELGGRAMSALGRIALIMLARARNSPDLRSELGRYVGLVRQVLEAPNGIAAFAAIVRYVLLVSELPPRQLEDFIRQLGPRAEEAYMTGAQQLTEQVRRDALDQGRAEGEAKAILRLLERRRVQLTAEQHEQILACTDLATLEEWLDRAIVATTANEVFG